MDSVLNSKGLSFSVEIARQGGKNELSSRLELLLLMLYSEAGGDIVKCSPTFKPQTLISMERLDLLMIKFGFEGYFKKSEGYIVNLGAARCIFLSADMKSSVVGHTASLLLEADESQDIEREKFHREFAPMAAHNNATRVFYGTTWDEFSLLEEEKQSNIEMEQKDGIKRHFSFDWQEVAKYNPAYGDYVAGERDRMGEDHPLFKTQYRLLPIAGGGRLFNRLQLVMLHGSYPEAAGALKGHFYVAGLDLAGQEQDTTAATSLKHVSRRDSVVLTIAEYIPAKESPPLQSGDALKLPLLNVVKVYAWKNQSYQSLYAVLKDLLKLWNISTCMADATGMGEPVVSFLKEVLGNKIESFVFTQLSKSKLGFNLYSFVNSGRLKFYQANNSVEYAEMMKELELARVVYRQNQTMNFYVEESEGHDDSLMSLALCVFAVQEFSPRGAKGGVRAS